MSNTEFEFEHLRENPTYGDGSYKLSLSPLFLYRRDMKHQDCFEMAYFHGIQSRHETPGLL